MIVDGVIAKIRKVILIQSVLIRWKRFRKQVILPPTLFSPFSLPSSAFSTPYDSTFSSPISSLPSSSILPLTSFPPPSLNCDPYASSSSTRVQAQYILV